MISDTSYADLRLLLKSPLLDSKQLREGISEPLKQSVMSDLIGHWDIMDSAINAEGVWQAGQGASWHFYPILNGHAIQDDWIAPPLEKPAPAGGRQFGTNIRIFNQNENRWEMAWASVKGQKVDTFTATESEGKITMTGKFDGQNSRITFYNITKQSFNWKLEFEQADKAWVEVYRIKGQRAITTP